MITETQLLNLLRVASKQGLDGNQLRFLRARLLLNKDFTPELQEKVQKIIDGVEIETRNLAREVEEFILSTTGNILSTEIYKCLQLSTRNDFKNVSIILKRLCNQGVIEKYGNRNGSWRLINKEEEDIDIFGEDEPDLNIKFPFYIEDLIIPMPKNVFIIAGEPNMGKTAFLLNFAELNMRQDDVYLFSSESGKRELRVRMKKFDIPFQDWKYLKIKERASDFQDVLRPDAINIIDFLEVTKDFWMVGDLIRQIYNKLNKGICFIAIQKNPQRKFKDGSESGILGIGGVRGLEKARLYLTMGNNSDGQHVCKIVKGKNWRHENTNPNGLELQFKLARGCHFTISKYWEKEGKVLKEKNKTITDKEKKRKDLFGDDPDFIPET